MEARWLRSAISLGLRAYVHKSPAERPGWSLTRWVTPSKAFNAPSLRVFPRETGILVASTPQGVKGTGEERGRALRGDCPRDTPPGECTRAGQTVLLPAERRTRFHSTQLRLQAKILKAERKFGGRLPKPVCRALHPAGEALLCKPPRLPDALPGLSCLSFLKERKSLRI